MNRSSRRTQKAITDAFLMLLACKPMRSITVKEIADRADITRATFYSHYDDIYDLLNKTREEALEHIVDLLERAIPSGDIAHFTLEFFTYFDENGDVFALIFGENGDTEFLVNALRELRETQARHFQKGMGRSSDKSIVDYQFSFLSGGVLHILTAWLAEKDRLPVEDIARITARFIEGAVLELPE